MNFSDTVLYMVYTCSLILKLPSLSKNNFLENKFTRICVLVHAMANMCVHVVCICTCTTCSSVYLDLKLNFVILTNPEV